MEERPRCATPGEHDASGNSRGRILAMRLGVNPNSSGHGVLWGALFFLPPTVVSLILAPYMEKKLESALELYQDQAAETVPSNFRERTVTMALWGASWALLSLAWGIFLVSLVPAFRWRPLVYLVPAILIISVTAAVVWAARNKSHLKVLHEVSLRAAAVSVLGMAPMAAIYLTWLRPHPGAFLPIEIGLAIGYLYGAPLALLLSISTLKASGLIAGRYRGTLVLAAYLAVGVILLFPFRLIPPGSYNAVGLLFPIWGLGGPMAASIFSLRHLSGGNDEDS